MPEVLDLTELSRKRPIREELILVGVYTAHLDTFDDNRLFTYRIGISQNSSDPKERIKFDQAKFAELMDEFLTLKLGKKRAKTWWRGERTWYWFINDTKIKNEFIAFIPRAQVLAKLSGGQDD